MAFPSGARRWMCALSVFAAPLSACREKPAAIANGVDSAATTATAPLAAAAPLVATFYTAYLEAVEGAGNPLAPGGALRAQVAQPFLDSLQRIASQGDVLDSDPLLLVQDWPDDWRTSVSAAVDSAASSTDTIRVRVRLGAADSTAAVREVLLTPVAAAWKIRSVRVR